MYSKERFRELLWETWHREAYGRSWRDLRDRLREAWDPSWEQYFELFEDARRDLMDLPPGIGWEEYCSAVMEAFLELLDQQADWQLYEAQSDGTGVQAYDPNVWGSGHGVEQDMSTQATPEVNFGSTGAGAPDTETAMEAMRVFASPDDEPSVLTAEHLAALDAMPIDVQVDASGPPDFDSD